MLSMLEYENGFETLTFNTTKTLIKISDFDESSQRFFRALERRNPNGFLSLREYKNGFTFIVEQLRHHKIAGSSVTKSDFDKIVHTRFCDWEDYTNKFRIVQVQLVFEAKFIFAWSMLQEYLERLNTSEKRTNDNFNEYRMPPTATKKVWYNLFKDSDLDILGKACINPALVGYIDADNTSHSRGSGGELQRLRDNWIESNCDSVIFEQIRKIQGRRQRAHGAPQQVVKDMRNMRDIESICTEIFPKKLVKICPLFYKVLKKHSIHWSELLPVEQLFEIRDVLIQYNSIKIGKMEAVNNIDALFKNPSTSKHQPASHKMYQGIKDQLDNELRLDVWVMIAHILVGISPNICALMSRYSIDFHPVQFTRFKAILIGYESGKILQKKDVIAEIIPLFTELSTNVENQHFSQQFNKALMDDQQFHKALMDDGGQKASTKDLDYEILSKISPYFYEQIKKNSIVFSPDQTASFNTILFSFREKIYNIKESLYQIGEIFKTLVTDTIDLKTKEKLMEALVNDYEMNNVDSISLVTTDIMCNALLTSNHDMVYVKKDIDLQIKSARSSAFNAKRSNPV